MKVKRKRELKRKWEKKTSGKVGRWGGSFPTWNKSKREKKRKERRKKGEEEKKIEGEPCVRKEEEMGRKEKGDFPGISMVEARLFES